jgi:SAM-dependent methyltransferase
VDQDGVADAAKRLGARGLLGKAACAARPAAVAAVPPPYGAGGRRLLRSDHRGWAVVLRRQFSFRVLPGGWQSLAQALDAHTDLVCELSGIRPGMRVLDVGCGIGEPARRIASRIDCEIVGLNIGCGQVRRGRELIARAGLAARVDIRHGNALHMPLPDGGFDAAICLEAAGDICVRAADKPRLLAELRRVLRPGGQVGFSDLVFDRPPTAAEDRALRSAVPLGPGAADRLAGPVRRRRVPAGNGA